MTDAFELLVQRAKTGDGALELRDTEHFYLDLSKLEPEVKKFLQERAPHMRDTVIGESLRKIESEGLKARSITRDLDWGIPVPVEGWTEAGKRIYVWFEAVIGYLSAPIEWAQLSGAALSESKGQREMRSPDEREQEWDVIEADLTGIVPAEEIQRMRIVDQQAWERGQRTLHIPTFFAWGKT